MSHDKKQIDLESDNMKVVFAGPPTGGLVSLTDKRTGKEFLRRLERPPVLWEITLCLPDSGINSGEGESQDQGEGQRATWTVFGGVFEGGERAAHTSKLLVTNRDARLLDIREVGVGRTGKRIIMIWTGFPKPLEDMRVVASAGLDSAASVLRLRLEEVNPGPRAGVWCVDFPIVERIDRIGSDGDGDELTVPFSQGLVIKDPLGGALGVEGTSSRLEWSYPGFLTMQWFSYYSKGTAGLYWATDDSLGFRKDFLLDMNKDKTMTLRVRNYPEDMGSVGRPYRPAYSLVLTTFEGGWEKASQIYRAWATSQPWCRRGKLSQRVDVPDWMKEVSLWVWNRGAAARVMPGALELKKRTGVNVGLDWYWWHNNPYDILMPEYLPPREGSENFSKAVHQLQSNGIRVIVYINGRLWDAESNSWREEKANLAAVKDENLKPYGERYNVFVPGHIVVPMCPTTELWMRKMASTVNSLVRDLSLDGVYLDQISIYPANLCFDPDHSHPAGGGNYWAEGYAELMRRTREVARKANPQASLTSESCVELYTDSFDAFLTFDATWERTGFIEKYGRNCEPIPLFNAVYHDYALTFGSYTSMTNAPPYDDLWPESSRPPEYGKFVSYHDRYPDQFAFEFARNIVWGIQPMVTNVYPEMLGRDEFEADMRFLETLTRFHAEAREYLVFGRWLPPPILECPNVQVVIDVGSVYTAVKDRREITKITPAVLSSAWASEDGRCCIILVNFSNHTVETMVRADIDRYGFQPHDRVIMTDYPERRNRVALDSHRFNTRLSMLPRSVVAYEFSLRAD